MQELFNLVSIRQMYNQELKLSMVEKFDTLISNTLDKLNEAPVIVHTNSAPNVFT